MEGTKPEESPMKKPISKRPKYPGRRAIPACVALFILALALYIFQLNRRLSQDITKRRVEAHAAASHILGLSAAQIAGKTAIKQRWRAR